MYLCVANGHVRVIQSVTPWVQESLSGNLCVRHNRREGAYYAEQSEEN